MAQIVLIAGGWVRTDLSFEGDVVAIHDDDVDLKGGAYSEAEVIKIEGKTAAQVRAAFDAKMPETKMVGEVEYWLNPADAKWYELKAWPKYVATARNLTTQDKTDLANVATIGSTRDTLLDKCEDKIAIDSKNTETEEPK